MGCGCWAFRLSWDACGLRQNILIICGGVYPPLPSLHLVGFNPPPTAVAVQLLTWDRSTGVRLVCTCVQEQDELCHGCVFCRGAKWEGVFTGVDLVKVS